MQYIGTALGERGSAGTRAAEHERCVESMARPDLPWLWLYHNGYACVKHLF
jgi:hypothetical protein